MIEPSSFIGLRLYGGFVIVRVEFVLEPLLDAIRRPALAKTHIVGQEISLTILSDLSEKEKSVTLYHEILEALTVASPKVPSSVEEFNEGDFERAAYEMHERFGTASPENVNRMLHFFDFREE